MSSNFCPFYVNIKVENPTPLMTHCGTEVLCEFFSKHRKQTVKRVYYIVSCFVLFFFQFSRISLVRFVVIDKDCANSALLEILKICLAQQYLDKKR